MKEAQISHFWPPGSWINPCPFPTACPIFCPLSCKMAVIYVWGEQHVKLAFGRRRRNIAIFNLTHLLVNFIPVELRLSLDLLALAFSSTSLFEVSFLKGSFFA